jgi:hypothetical protein
MVVTFASAREGRPEKDGPFDCLELCEELRGRCKLLGLANHIDLMGCALHLSIAGGRRKGGPDIRDGAARPVFGGRA